MKRIRLTVAYDGTNYCGWQLQPNGVTIEEILNGTLSELLKEPVCVIGASRTDSGVHAEGNVAVFDTESRIPADKLCFALNQRLPEDIRILRSEEVPAGWHPRKQNCTKIYEYRIQSRKIELPTRRLYAHFCYYPLDVNKMRRGAAYLVGEHDFASFCSARHQAEETVRTLYAVTVEKDRDEVITIRLSGSGFLYNMVRIIAGTLMKVGMGVYPPEHVKEILEARDRQAAGQTAPARGLTLIGIEYETAPAETIEAENEHWSYILDQRALLTDESSVLTIRYCEEAELNRLVRRMVNQAYRNGAKRVIVKAAAESSVQPEASVKTAETFGAARTETANRAGAQGVPDDHTQYGLYRLLARPDGSFEAVYTGKEGGR